jgi:hypothetical protein
MVKYWLGICKMTRDSIIYQAYLQNKQMLVNKEHCSWLKGIDNLLKYCSFDDVLKNEKYSVCQ